ncbi:hypothetical protein KY321_03990 [Candidatus Woesearchaeota archaeon]|nr:hypothetical protein [Candidatus Woesearchaeota archaeon]
MLKKKLKPKIKLSNSYIKKLEFVRNLLEAHRITIDDICRHTEYSINYIYGFLSARFIASDKFLHFLSHFIEKSLQEEEKDLQITILKIHEDIKEVKDKIKGLKIGKK